MSNNNHLNIKIAQLRKKRGLTQLDLALRLGVRESTVANWENGRNGAEWFERLAKLCDYLDCRAQDLIEYSNQVQQNRPNLPIQNNTFNETVPENIDQDI